MLEAATEDLHLAVAALGVPPRARLREEEARFAPHIGLIGSAAEVAMGACLVQTFGSQALLAAPTRFKSAREILADFRKLLESPVPRASFLVSGMDDGKSHLALLAGITAGFSHLMTARAGGLHAGRGPLREACFFLAGQVSAFLECLAGSSRIRPYLEFVPAAQGPQQEMVVLVEDLVKRARIASPGEAVQLITSLVLILPELPGEEPKWLEGLSRLAVAPRPSDVSLLLDSLTKALPITLQRVGRKGQGRSVVVRPHDPEAIAIAPQFLSRSFTEIKEQWWADVGNANARL